MPNPFIQKLALRAHLDAQDIEALRGATCDVTQVDAGRDLSLDGSTPGVAYVILEGFACRYKLVDDGGRSILAYLVPGDGCDLHASLLNRAINSVATLTPCTIASISYQMIKGLAASRPNIFRALWWSVLVDEAVLQEWLVGIGRRSADRQIAHLLCELLTRLQAIGLATEPDYRLPLTQSELADTAGLSNIHLSRVLADLRKAGLIKSGRKSISVPDIRRLQTFAGFDPGYLLLSGPNANPTELGALPGTTGLIR
ncbi:Crp/Fnr family transcriptional regulator [Methylobacterium sp. J-030]|uniref:Crp/Fnr family transcriptional regulator n=1 Tax=Methylobacterium sp. J-030 TaxID=2836627 RepID=UPI001FBB8105|nr:Crp/Fnr family transcriptional regulator [Methylobacterium sp. J-030]MCJ2068863.1 Crp/Fnr family transcriptional regulator [Methylobacterium sp. J-030]